MGTVRNKIVSNAEKYPEAWKFYIEQARNMEEEDYPFKYRIPIPDMSGNFIDADTVEELWSKFIHAWFSIESLEAPTVRGKIQYIVKTFKG